MKGCLQRCPECHAAGNDKTLPVSGEGDRRADVFFCFEQPGKFENDLGRPMVGKTGDELTNLYLGLAGLSRSDVWIDNICKCKFADSGEVPPDSVVRSCAEFHLRPTLERINPKFLVLSGGLANTLWPSPLSIDATQGYWERDVQIWGWRGSCLRIYHPSLGIHLPARMQNLLDSFREMRYILRGDREPPVDLCPNPKFHRLRTAAEVREVLESEDDFEVMAIDTESKKTWGGYKSTIKYVKYCLQFCIHEGSAYLILVEDENALAEFARHIRRWRHLILWNAPHDVRVMLDMGIDVPWDKVLDAMSLSYLDGRTQKGLKNASFQLLTSAMRNFDDVVRPHGIKAVMEYMEKATCMEWSVPEPEPTGEFGERNCVVCKGKKYIIQGRGKAKQHLHCDVCSGTGREQTIKYSRRWGVGQRINKVISDWLKDPDSETFDPWDRWENWPEEQIEELMAQLGPLPLASVELAPYEELEAYACSDSTSTRRLYPVLLQRLAEIGRSTRR